MEYLFFLIVLVFLSAVGCEPASAAESAPLLAAGATVTGYMGFFLVLAAMVWLGCWFGKRDRAKVKADLLKTKSTKAYYEIRERYGPVSGVTFAVYRELDGVWCKLSPDFDSLYQAEGRVLDYIRQDGEANRVRLVHRYERDGTPIPPAPALHAADKRP